MLSKNLIELYNIIVLACVYLFFGVLFSITMNHAAKYIFRNAANPMVTIIYICTIIIITVVYAYIIHDIMYSLPLPLIGDKHEVSNLINVQKGTIIFALSLFLFQLELKDQIIKLSRYF